MVLYYIVVLYLYDSCSGNEMLLRPRTDKVSDWLVNTVEHLAANETDISLELVETKIRAKGVGPDTAR